MTKDELLSALDAARVRPTDRVVITVPSDWPQEALEDLVEQLTALDFGGRSIVIAGASVVVIGPELDGGLAEA